MVTVGAVLSTAKVALGPAAGAELPALSVAVPAGMEMPTVPLPVSSLRVIVQMLLLGITSILLTMTVPVLLRFSKTCRAVSELALKFASE